MFWHDALVAAPGLVGELWQQQSVWSQTANRLKQRIDRARLIALIVVVLVAVCGTAAAAIAAGVPLLGRVLAGVAAAGSALLPTLRPAWSGSRLRDWTRVRSVSEALKSEVYLWLARAGAYRTDPEALLLQERTDRIRADAADLTRYRHGIEPIGRELPRVSDARSFFAVRVTDQIDDYYQRRADRIRVVLGRFRVVEVVLGLTGATVGAVAAVLGASFASWMSVLATVGTALAVHVSAGRYEFQLIEFLRTAEQLRLLRSAADRPDQSEAALSDLVAKAEQVISVENQGWMVKLAEAPPEQQASATEKA